jgi:YVTN family beta-propeller protein
MKTYVMGAAVAVALCLAGCSQPSPSGGSSASGSVAVTHDDALLYAADSDRDEVLVIDTALNRSSIQTIKVGRQPEKVLMSPDDTLFVTNRMGRSVSVIRRGELAEAARIPVGVEPVGLALTADGKTLYVVNTTALTSNEYGTLMAVDTATLSVSWELPIGPEPRGIALLENNRAAITLYKAGDVVLVDLAKQQLTRSGSDVREKLNTNAFGGTAGFKPVADATVRPHGLEAVLATPDGKQFFSLALLGAERVLEMRKGGDSDVNIDPTVSSGGYGSGSCGGSVVSPAILTFDSDGNADVDDATTCHPRTDLTRPPTPILTNMPGTPIQGPVAMTFDPSGAFILVVNRESNNVAIIPTTGRATEGGSGKTNFEPTAPRFELGGTVRDVAQVGAGPTGIAVSHDGTKAWTFNAFDHSISELQMVGGRLSARPAVRLADDVLDVDVVQGRKFFFSAVDTSMSNVANGIACASCHLEVGDDGHVWNFADGPRQTPALAGRQLLNTAPFHWNGEFPDLMAFMSHTIVRRMGGSGVTPIMEQQIAKFLMAANGPDNAARSATDHELVARGRGVYEKAGCQECHAGAALTDNRFADVGTQVNSGLVRDQLPYGLNTPSLLGIGRSAPYLHDGSVPTLKARIMLNKSNNLHGQTAALTNAEVDDLVAYLQTL